MIFQRILALSEIILFRQNVTTMKSAVVILNPRLKFSGNNAKNAPAGITTTPPSPSSSEDKERQSKLIKLEISNLQENGARAPNPELINKNQWEELLQLKTKSARSKYYGFLFGLQKIKENLLNKRQEKRQALEKFKAQRAVEAPDSPNIASTFTNKFMLRIHPETINKWNNNRLFRAMQFGEKLVFDCSYDPHMTRREASSTATQLMLSFAANRRHKDPFDLHFCNAIPDSSTMKYLEQRIPTVRNNDFPLNLHEGSYLDLFPKNRLVYLTPHCNVDLVEYDPDDVYIIGATVDKVNQQPLSLGKAKSLGLRMARLPLDRYIKWGSGSGKSLTLDQMTKIMLDIKTTRDWAYSLRHVPTRKIASGAIPPTKIVKKWTATVDVPKFNSYTQKDDNTISTEDIVKKKMHWKSNSTFDSYHQKDDNTISTADKFKRKIKWNKK